MKDMICVTRRHLYFEEIEGHKTQPQKTVYEPEKLLWYSKGSWL